MGVGHDWYNLRCVGCCKVTAHIAVKDKGQFRCMVCDELFGSRRTIQRTHSQFIKKDPVENRGNIIRIQKSLSGHTGES